ncbi:acyltransferase domain-containing protein [Bifidobacterium felsineum]|uniref:acyltransferase domain-containing protein n=1 Tax=Bifidobacterium felsineum TaxID=2045440 RepID=UPI001F0AB05D|nr:acyltransferase domain-containing protein [Bifidobacterium felsineum]
MHGDDADGTELTVMQVAKRIGMAEPVIDVLRQIQESGETLAPEGNAAVRGLTDPSQRAASWHALKSTLGNDPDGFRILYWMLYAAGRYTFPTYARMGIPATVFDDTMGCFSRFVDEHQVSYGKYGFDRDFWTYRELSARLFRLGTLEFELAYEADDVPAIAGMPRIINIHIPSNASLDPEHCDASIASSRDFLASFFPNWAGLPYWCESWLLSPALNQLLPERSHILAFQRRFDIRETNPDADDWREWVFQRNNAPIAELPERTSLQRNMKRFLLGGGKVGIGIGRLR